MKWNDQLTCFQSVIHEVIKSMNVLTTRVYTHINETIGYWVENSIQTKFYYNHSQCCKIHFWVGYRWSAYVLLSRVEYKWPVYIPPRFHEFWNTQLSYTNTMSFTNTKTFWKTKASDQTRGQMMKLCKENIIRWHIWYMSMLIWKKIIVINYNKWI
jgi:hypothetical protein